DPHGAHEHRLSNLLTHALGTTKQPSVDLGGVDALVAGDTFLLCSDGLWHYFSDAEIATVLATYAPRRASERLIELARQRADGRVLRALRRLGLRVALVRQLHDRAVRTRRSRGTRGLRLRMFGGLAARLLLSLAEALAIARATFIVGLLIGRTLVLATLAIGL